MKILLLLLIPLLTSCGATLDTVYDEDLSEFYGHKGGEFSYVERGVNSYEDGIRQAAEVCNGLMPKVVRSGQKITSSVMAMPVNSTVTNYGRVGNTSYSGTSSFTSYQYIPVTSTSSDHQFICPDSDLAVRAYVLDVSETTSEPNCFEIDKHFLPGVRRINILTQQPNAINCVKQQGWMRFYERRLKGSMTIFLGEKGLNTCRQLRGQMINELITHDKANLYILKNLVCSEKKP